MNKTSILVNQVKDFFKKENSELDGIEFKSFNRDYLLKVKEEILKENFGKYTPICELYKKINLEYEKIGYNLKISFKESN